MNSHHSFNYPSWDAKTREWLTGYESFPDFHSALQYWKKNFPEEAQPD